MLQKKSLFIKVVIAFAFSAVTASAAPLIHESFSQTGGSLGGATGGTGLNAWSINQTVDVVETPTLTYGDLQNSGGQAEMPSNSGVYAYATVTSALGDAGLLNDGATLWFSYMHEKASDGGSNEKAGFAFGTDNLAPAYNGLNMSNGGNGLGVKSSGTSANVAAWSGGGKPTSGSGHAITLNESIFLVGKIEWGVGTADETITLYSPSTSDLATQGTGYTLTMAGVDQTLFDTVSFGQRNSGGTQIYDEIRFGATYEDVSPGGIPEPATLAFLGLGGLLVSMRRRRR